MQKLLIIGCGDVARRALPRLVQRYHVFALLRSPEAELVQRLRTLGVHILYGDLDQANSLRRLTGLADLVLHSAPPASTGNRDWRTRRLIAALRRGKQQVQDLVYISTSGVYGDCQGDFINETRPLKPSTDRAKRRVDAEQQLRHWCAHGGPRLSILRVPGIYATDRLPIARIQRGDPVLCQEDDVYTNHIHADDLVQCLLAALHHGRANRIYHATDHSAGNKECGGLRMADWFDAVADTHGLPRPPRIHRNAAKTQLPALVLSFMGESRRLDNTRLLRELRVKLRYPTITEGLTASIHTTAPSRKES